MEVLGKHTYKKLEITLEVALNCNDWQTMNHKAYQNFRDYPSTPLKNGILSMIPSLIALGGQVGQHMAFTSLDQKRKEWMLFPTDNHAIFPNIFNIFVNKGFIMEIK